MQEDMDLAQLSDSELVNHMRDVLGSRRQLTAKLVACLGEVEARNLHLKEAYASMYDFCVNGLAMSGGEAHRTLAGARAARRFPQILELIREGALHLSGLELLHKYLTSENHNVLLNGARGKGKREIEELLRAHFPRPDVPSRILPQPHSLGLDANGAPADSTGAAAGCGNSGAETLTQTAGVKPLSAQRFHIQFTASAEFRSKLERVQALMRHQNPRGDLALTLDRALDLLLADLEKKRLAKTERPGRERPRKHGTISRAVRREVFQRDGEQCTFVSETGQRCTSRTFLELDHVQPRALGGSGEARNIRVLCGAHNQLAADETFGAAHVEHMVHLRRRGSIQNGAEGRAPQADGEGASNLRQRRSMENDHAVCADLERVDQTRGAGADASNLRQRRSIHENTPPAPTLAAVQRSNGELRDSFEKLVRALTGLGFRERTARLALGTLAQRHASDASPVQLDALLREALAILTS